MMSHRPATDIFSHIVAVSRGFMSRHPSTSTAANSPSSSEELTIPDCTFPQPQSLRLDLELGLENYAAEKLSLAYLRAATRLKARYEKHFQHTCEGLIKSGSPLCSDLTRLHSAYVSIYTERLDVWVKQFKSYRVRAHEKEIIVVSTRPKRSFSQRTITILERFFERNAFPSRSEKANLAAQANIKYAQVHIWFQNRRRRFRKEGKELKRAQCALSPTKFEASVVETSASSRSGVYSADGASECCGLFADILNPNAPHHAFPSAYPPTCPYDPFPIEDGTRKFITPWARKPSSANSGSSFDIDMAQLTSLFMKLTIDNGPRSFDIGTQRGSCTGLPSRGTSNALGFATIVPRAPHPALIPNVTLMSSICPTGIPTVSSNLIGPIELDTACSQTTIPTLTKNTVSRRKVAPLPKRLPTGKGIARRVESSVMTDATLSYILNSAVSLNSTSLSSTSHPHPQTTSDSLSKPAALQQNSSRRRVAALPKRTAMSSNPSEPRFIAGSSRTPSASSSTSSGSSSPSGPDTPLSTPPSLPTSLPPSKTLTLCALRPVSGFNSLLSEPSSDESSPTEGLQLQLQGTVRIASYGSS